MGIHIVSLCVLVASLVGGAIAGITPRVALAQDDAEMKANKELVAKVYDEVINNRNYEVLADYAAPGLVEHRREGDVTYDTPEDYIKSTEADLKDFPADAHLTIDYQLADGDQVVNHFTLTLGDSGVSTKGISIFRVQDGKIVELEEILDEAGLRAQLQAGEAAGGEGSGETGATDEVTPTEKSAPAPQVIADGLNGPMGLLLDDDGNLFVVDSGIGGDQTFTTTDPESGSEVTVSVGNSSRIVEIVPDGTQTEVANLPSVLEGGEASGGNRLALLDGVLYATSGGWQEGLPMDRPSQIAAVVSVGKDGTVDEVANTWDTEVAQNPDGFVKEAHPYGLAAGPDGLLWVADAGANDVLTVDPESGEVKVVATIDGITGPVPNSARGDAMEEDPVPTGIVPTKDGGAFVSLLSGFPFVPGSSKIVAISSEGDVSDYATGLTMITDLRMGPDGDLYAVQIGEFTAQGPKLNSGAIWHIHEGDASEVVYSGLSFPTSLAFTKDGDAYITVNGTGEPGSGQVILVPGLTGMKAVAPEASAGETEAVSETISEGGAPTALPIPKSALGPEIPQDTGYVVQEVGRHLYWVTDGVYQTMFLTTGKGVIVVDAPPSMGKKLLDAIASVTDEPITHVIYSHAHADHIGAASMYPPDATYIAQAETAAALEDRAADDPNQENPFGVFSGGGPVPLPTVTFEDSYTLTVGDQTLELSYHGANHSHGNTFIYAPEQKVLMVVDIVFPGWSPFRQVAVSEDVPGYIAAHDEILAYDFDVYIGGHVGRYGTREDVETQKEYFEDMIANAKTALQTTDFNAIAAQTGYENIWLLYNTYLDAAAQNCAKLTIEKWGDKLAAADLNSAGHCDRIIEALRVN